MQIKNQLSKNQCTVNNVENNNEQQYIFAEQQFTTFPAPSEIKKNNESLYNLCDPIQVDYIIYNLHSDYNH